jgi:small subunit ribosomal protein S3Ae
MAPKKRKIAQPKAKKKKWYVISAPALFNETPIGETYLSSVDELSNKYATVNLSTLTRSMRKQNVNVMFKVSSVVDDKAKTEIIGYSLVNAAMKRLVRRGRDKIIDSFLAKTKDEKILRVKPLILTLNCGTHSMQTAVRLETRRFIREFFFSKTVEEIFSEIINEKLQKELKKIVLKIVPLKSVDFKTVRLEENANVIINKDGVITEKVTIRRKDKGEKHLTEEELVALLETKALSDQEQIEHIDQENFDDEEFGDNESDLEDDASKDSEINIEEDSEASIDDDEADLDEEEVELINKGEEEADDSTIIQSSPETVVEEMDEEDSLEEAEAKSEE